MNELCKFLQVVPPKRTKMWMTTEDEEMEKEKNGAGSGAGNDLGSLSGGLRLVDHSSGADIMLVVISVVHRADHHARNGSMNELIIPQIDANMGDGPVFAKGMKKYQVPFLQVVPADPPGSVELFLCRAGQGSHAVN